MAAECARADVRDERRVWHTQRQPRMRQQPHRLVFLDETYVNTKMTRLRGRSRKGQRLRMQGSLRPLEDPYLSEGAFMMPPFLVVWCVAAEPAGHGSDRLPDQSAKAVLCVTGGRSATHRPDT